MKKTTIASIILTLLLGPSEGYKIYKSSQFINLFHGNGYTFGYAKDDSGTIIGRSIWEPGGGCIGYLEYNSLLYLYKLPRFIECKQDKNAEKIAKTVGIETKFITDIEMMDSERK